MTKSSRMKTGLLIVLTVSMGWTPGLAQKLKRADKELAAELSQYGSDLRGDTGFQEKTPQACVYLSTVLARAGLTGSADAGSFVRVVRVDEGKVIAPRCSLSFDGRAAVPGTDFFPLVGCPDAHAGGSTGISLNERGLPWIYDLRYDLEGGKGNPAFDIRKTLAIKTEEARRKGATALLLYNSSALPDGFSFDASDKKTVYTLPIVYINKRLSAKVFKDPTAYVDVDLTVAIQDKAYNLYSVEGYVDNGASKTVILESSYDTTAGAAALLGLVHLVKHAGWKKHNYLVIAYNGGRQTEALDAYFAKHPALQKDRVEYVVNVEGLGSPDPGHPELWVKAWQGRPDWKTTFSGRKESFLKVMYEDAPGDTLGIPSGAIAFSIDKPGIPGYDGEALALRYIFNSLAAVEKQ